MCVCLSVYENVKVTKHVLYIYIIISIFRYDSELSIQYLYISTFSVCVYLRKTN